MSGTERRKCADCGATNFLNVIRQFCVICEDVWRCQPCHQAHRVHVGVIRVRVDGGEVYKRAPL